MKKKLLILIGIFVLTVVSYKVTFALFSNQAASTNNVFSAAQTFPTATPTPSPTPIPIVAGDIIINEINWAGSNGDGNDEWVELRNTTSHSININGWVVENLGTGSGSGITIASASASVPANGFFLISSFSKSGSKINIDPDYITTSISLSNGGEQLVLRTSASGTTIDTANGTGAWFEGSNSTPKKSMERKTPPADGTQALNWQTATTHTNMDGGGSTDEFATPKAVNGL